jgi:hypothetical protein
MSAPVASVNGLRVERLRLHVPFCGAWTVEVEFEEAIADSNLVGQARVQIGSRTLSGTFDPDLTGSYLHISRALVRAGAGAWSSTVGRREYHDDGLGVKASTVVEDLAREVGETVGSLSPARDRLGQKFERREGPASAALTLAVGAVPWWVDYEGVTNVGARAAVEASAAYEILDVDPRFKTVEIAAEDPAAIGIGTVLRGRLSKPLTVRELAIEIGKDNVRLLAWGTEGSLATYQSRSRLLRDIQAMARAAIPELPYLKAYRYRVSVANAGDHRWKLQAVAGSNRLPDISPAAVHPGVAGLVAKLALGAEVLVEFVEADPSRPVITHFQHADGAGFLPLELALDAEDKVQIGEDTTLLELGKNAAATRIADGIPVAQGIARMGDSVSVMGVTGAITSASVKGACG